MQGKAKVHNFKFRLALTIILVLSGFAFPILFVLAVLIGWSLIKDVSNPPQEVDAWFTRRWMATADDPSWRSYFLPFCESPAETTFLEAMISAYGLTPDKGMLCGSGLTLDLQVIMPPYRADFLVNSWLVVEVDGATYHSSPEAIERDKARDESMKARGYFVLRIPASVVFSTPDEAVRRVSTLIANDSRTYRGLTAEIQKEKKKSVSLQGILSSVNDAVSDINRNISIREAVERETKGYADKFYAERLAIEKAVELAESEIRVDKYISQSEKHRELYSSAYKELQEILNNEEPGSGDINTAWSGATISIPRLPKIDPHPDPGINEAILNACQSIDAERDEFFGEVRSKLSGDDKLKDLVRGKLYGLRCEECWKYIS